MCGHWVGYPPERYLHCHGRMVRSEGKSRPAEDVLSGAVRDAAACLSLILYPGQGRQSGRLPSSGSAHRLQCRVSLVPLWSVHYQSQRGLQGCYITGHLARPLQGCQSSQIYFSIGRVHRRCCPMCRSLSGLPPAV